MREGRVDGGENEQLIADTRREREQQGSGGGAGKGVGGEWGKVGERRRRSRLTKVKTVV